MSSHPKVEEAFVLAAGKGERLRPLTEKTPKPLLEVRGKKILDHVLERLTNLGLKRVVVNSWYLGDQIKDYVNKSQNRFGFELVLSEEAELLGTGGGLKQALQFLSGGPFLMLNGDCIWKGDLKSWIQKREAAVEASWILTDPEPDQTEIGVRSGRLVQLGSLWRAVEPEIRGCFTGIQLIHEIHKDELPNVGCIMRQYWVPRLQKKSQIATAFHLLSAWEDLGTPERLQSAAQDDRLF